MLAMKPITMLFLILAFAATFCSSHALSIGSPHIIGGKPWEHPTHPEVFELKLYKDGEFKRACKASEYTPRNKRSMWITAAECLDTEKYDHIAVKFVFKGKSDEVKFILDDSYVYRKHPGYNKRTGEHNIGLIVPLLDYVDKDPSLRRIKLPTAGESYMNKEAQVFLKYAKSDQAESYDIIESLPTRIVHPGWCKSRYSHNLAQNNFICTTGLNNQGLTKDDVGIPLVVQENDDTFKLLGIAAKVYPWAHLSGLPMEFLNIEPYLDWIGKLYE